MLVISVIMIMVARVVASETTENLVSDQRLLCNLGCECQNLIFLDCKGKGISNLPPLLHLNSNVTKVSFESNHLENLMISTFSVADYVTELDFSSNLLRRIDNFSFTPFKSLTHLRLSNNHLPELLPGMLEGLFELRVLDLSHNLIQTVTHLAFESTQKLQELRLQYNPIFDLPENIFRYLPNLEKLDLKDTGLVTLPMDLFRPNSHLFWLSLATNAFEYVPEEALSGASQLEILDLSENDFTILAGGSFKRLSNITVLYLNNLDFLTRIERDAFIGLRKLKVLSCSFNKKLSYIDEHIFGTGHNTITPPREQLHFRQNALRSLQSPLKQGTWKNLGFVDLAENPWKCDCNLLWMTELTRETQTSIRCETPRKLRGRTFNTIDPGELRCDTSNWALATVALVVACMVAFGAVMLAVTAIVCSRTPVGLFVRAKHQFSYDKVKEKTESVDLEWDPSADM